MADQNLETITVINEQGDERDIPAGALPFFANQGYQQVGAAQAAEPAPEPAPAQPRATARPAAAPTTQES